MPGSTCPATTIVTTTVPSPDVPRSEAETAEDQRLLEAARHGDDGAFARMIERADPLLFELAAGMLDDDGIDPMLTESYVRAYRSIGRQQGDPLPWLLRITYLTCLAEARRRERRRIGGPGRLPDRTPEPDIVPLAGIAPDERAVLILVDGAGLPEDAVAAALETPVETVRSLLARARTALDEEADLPDAVVTGHEPDFWRNLGARLLAERESPAVAVPDLPTPSDRAGARPAQAPPVAMQRRAPRAARQLRREPDSVDGLVVGAKRQRGRRPIGATLRRALVAIVVLGLIAAGVVAVVHYGAKAKSPVRKDSIAEISRRTTDALQVDTFTARFTRVVVDAKAVKHTATYELVRNATGSYVLTTTTTGRVVAYDAASNTRETRTGGATPAGLVALAGSQDAGLAAGPPDVAPGDSDLPDAELDRALRTLGTVADEEAGSVTVHGVAAWKLAAPLPDSSALGADEVELIVDKDRLAPISVTYRSGSKVVRSLTFEKVVLNGPAPGPFTIDLTGAAVTPVDRGFVPVNVSAASAQTGYQPLRPTFLPPGFELAAATVRVEGKVLALRYQRGFQQVVITTRTSPVAKGVAWPSPFPGAAFEHPRSVPITAGPYRGTTAQRTGSIGSVPALWGTDGTLAFTVWGDLSDAELVQLAESLR